jgi:hypothetical protein
VTDRIVAERFALVAREGGDGATVVWRARDLSTSAAVRVVLAGAADAVAQLERAARLRHPTLLPLIASGRDGGEAYAVIPLVDGVTLDQRIARAGRMRSAHAAAFALPLAEGLTAAHAAGCAFAGFMADAITVGEGAVPWFRDLPLAAATPTATEGDVRGLGAVLAVAVGGAEGIDDLDRPDLSPRFIALVRSLGAAEPPTAAEAAAALAHLVDAETHAETSAPWEPFAPPLAARREVPETSRPQPRRRRLVIGALAALAALGGGVALGAMVAQREGGGVAADEILIPTATLMEEGPAITTIMPPPPETVAGAETTTTSAAPSMRVVGIPISRIRSFDSAGDGENDADLRRAIDGSRGTAWSTEVYRTAGFGTKAGIGLGLELALPAEVRAIRIRSRPPGATVRIFLDRGPAPAGAPDGWTPAGRPVPLRDPVTTIRVRSAPAATRVLVWISELPRRPNGGFAVEILELEVRGVPAGA